MSKALVTFGVGAEHGEYLALARPCFQEYAARHGYAYREQAIAGTVRPPSWSKVTMLVHLLKRYDTVLWVDCDVVIVDGSADLADDVPPQAWQALVMHTDYHGVDMGQVPNCGVWLVREPMLPILRHVWRMTQYTDHPWWEQAALHELMGFAPTTDALTPVRHHTATALYRRTHWLDERWNWIDTDREDAAPRFVHMAGLAHVFRLGEMEYWSKRARELA